MAIVGDASEVPLVEEDPGMEGRSGEKLIDKLLDRTGYGFFHVLLVLGERICTDHIVGGDV